MRTPATRWLLTKDSRIDDDDGGVFGQTGSKLLSVEDQLELQNWTAALRPGRFDSSKFVVDFCDGHPCHSAPA